MLCLFGKDILESIEIFAKRGSEILKAVLLWIMWWIWWERNAQMTPPSPIRTKWRIKLWVRDGKNIDILIFYLHFLSKVKPGGLIYPRNENPSHLNGSYELLSLVIFCLLLVFLFSPVWVFRMIIFGIYRLLKLLLYAQVHIQGMALMNTQQAQMQ